MLKRFIKRKILPYLTGRKSDHMDNAWKSRFEKLQEEYNEKIQEKKQAQGKV